MPTQAIDWMLPVMAGVTIGLLCAAMRVLWTRLDETVDKLYATSTEVAVLREKIKSIDSENNSD